MSANRKPAATDEERRDRYLAAQSRYNQSQKRKVVNERYREGTVRTRKLTSRQERTAELAKVLGVEVPL